MSVYLGVDIGTSGTKTLAMRRDGKILDSATATYPLLTPAPGWSEQDPEEWWQATIKTIRAILKKGIVKPSDVSGIGLSGQMHGSVFLDEKDQVIRPALLWNDQRTEAECAEIEKAAGGRKKLIEMVANPALTGFTAPKILWLRNAEPKNYDRIKQILLPKDFVRHRLTGEFATEVSDASGTLLLDVKNRCWSKKLLSKLNIDTAWLPRVYESEEVSGRLNTTAARLLGLPVGVPVVGGGGDQAASAVGNGIVRKGVVSATMGTSGVVFAHSDEVQYDPLGRLHTFCHAVRGKWHMMGVVLSAGGSLQWYRDEMCQAEVSKAKKTRIDPYDLIMEEASHAPPGCEGLVFLPYLTGERTPHADANARGAWIGLSRRHKRPHLTRSVIEGATFAMRDSLQIIQDLNVPAKEVRLSGGGARSAFWRQIQSDVYGLPCALTNSHEGPAYGVALLAAVGTGSFKTVVEACQETIQVVSQTAPNPRSKKIYDVLHPQYQNLYTSLKDNFKSLAGYVKATTAPST